MRTGLVTVRGAGGMNVKILDDEEAMSMAAAGCVTRLLEQRRRLLICLATGATPALTYELIARKAGKCPALFDQLRVLKLDEWEGLPHDDPGSCEVYLRQRVVRPWGIHERRFVGFGQDSRQADAECERIQGWLARNGPIDLCVLGLGGNGHLGFNEPGKTLCPVAHRARLSKESRAHSMMSRAAVKPSYGLTMGMAEILQARRILLLVSGAHKRKPLRRLLRREISTEFPASLLHLHAQTTIFCDRAAFGSET